MALVLLFEDKINGYIARKRMIKGTEKVTIVFNEDGYASTTDIGKTEWYYKNINQIAETDEFFVFIFDQSHGQVYDKKKALIEFEHKLTATVGEHTFEAGYNQDGCSYIAFDNRLLKEKKRYI
jgi:hypothetical protein